MLTLEFDDKSTLPPEHIVLDAEVIVALGNTATVIVNDGLDEKHPKELVTTSLMTPAEVADNMAQKLIGR